MNVKIMDKTEQVKQWLSETSSYEGCVYVAVDKMVIHLVEYIITNMFQIDN